MNTRFEWLDWRRHGIGGSDLPALCGMSRFATPTTVYLEKVGLLVDDSQTEAMRWGLLLEDAIAREFEVRTGLSVLDTQLCLEQPERDWQRCTLDGLVGEGGAVYAAADDGDALGAATGILEVKNSGAFGWDEIPDEYQAQCQWNMGIAGKPQAWLAVLHAGRRLRIYELPFDPEAFEIFTDIARRFWHDHVLARNPPPVDSSDATAEALKAAYRDRADDTAIVFDAELRDLAVEWRHARRVCEEAEARKTLAESRLRQALGESTAGMFDGEPLVTWKPQRRAGRIREADLRAAHPDLARQFSEPDGVTRVLRATKTLKTLAGED